MSNQLEQLQLMPQAPPAAASDPTRQSLSFGDLATELLARPGIARVVLVPAGEDDCGCLARAMDELGSRVIVARQPLDVIVALNDADLDIAAVVAPLGEKTEETLALLSFLQEECPEVRRLGYHATVHEVRGGHEPATASSQLHILPNRWGPAVELAVEVGHRGHVARPLLSAPTAAEAMPTNEALLQAWKPSDPASFRAVERRYTDRIQALAGEMGFDESDAADISQETLLRLFERARGRLIGLPEFVVGHLAAESMGGRAHGNRRRERLVRACRYRSADDTRWAVRMEAFA